MKLTSLTAEILPEKELLALIAQGSDAAFRILYDTYRKKIYSYAVQLTRSTDDADEIVQEVFLKCWLKREELTQVEHCNAWLHTIARHLFVDRLRRMAKEEEGLAQLRIATEQTTSIDHFILDKENELLLRQSMERLPLQQRAVFELSRRQGLGREEIALQLGISENTVRVHLTRALASMRDFLGRHADLSAVLLLLWSRRS